MLTLHGHFCINVNLCQLILNSQLPVLLFFHSLLPYNATCNKHKVLHQITSELHVSMQRIGHRYSLTSVEDRGSSPPIGCNLSFFEQLKAFIVLSVLFVLCMSLRGTISLFHEKSEEKRTRSSIFPMNDKICSVFC